MSTKSNKGQNSDVVVHPEEEMSYDESYRHFLAKKEAFENSIETNQSNLQTINDDLKKLK